MILKNNNKDENNQLPINIIAKFYFRIHLIIKNYCGQNLIQFNKLHGEIILSLYKYKRKNVIKIAKKNPA